jgi:hypothetical protein
MFGELYIQNLTSNPSQNPVLICSGELMVDWEHESTLGGLFMSLHSFLLVFSAATIVRTFYLLPKK